MLSLSIFFFVVAVIAAVFGFTGIAVGAAGVAKILFFVFLALFVISMLVRALQGKSVAAVLLIPVLGFGAVGCAHHKAAHNAMKHAAKNAADVAEEVID